MQQFRCNLSLAAVQTRVQLVEAQQARTLRQLGDLMSDAKNELEAKVAHLVHHF